MSTELPDSKLRGGIPCNLQQELTEREGSAMCVWKSGFVLVPRCGVRSGSQVSSGKWHEGLETLSLKSRLSIALDR